MVSLIISTQELETAVGTVLADLDAGRQVQLPTLDLLLDSLQFVGRRGTPTHGRLLDQWWQQTAAAAAAQQAIKTAAVLLQVEDALARIIAGRDLPDSSELANLLTALDLVGRGGCDKGQVLYSYWFERFPLEATAHLVREGVACWRERKGCYIPFTADDLLPTIAGEVWEQDAHARRVLRESIEGELDRLVVEGLIVKVVNEQGRTVYAPGIPERQGGQRS